MLEFKFSLKNILPKRIVIIGTDNDNSEEINGFVILRPMNPNNIAKNIISAIKKTNFILFMLFLTISIISFLGWNKNIEIPIKKTVLSWVNTDAITGIEAFKLYQCNSPDEEKNSAIKLSNEYCLMEYSATLFFLIWNK